MYLRIPSPKPPYQVGEALRRKLKLDGWAGVIDDEYLEFEEVELVHSVFQAPPVRVFGAIRQADNGCVVEYRPSWYTLLIWISIFSISTIPVLFSLDGLPPFALLLAFLAFFLSDLLRIHLMLKSIATDV